MAKELTVEERLELKKKIDEIPWDGEWWHRDNGDAFVGYALILMEHGFDMELAVEFLQGIYGTVSDEYGN